MTQGDASAAPRDWRPPWAESVVLEGGNPLAPGFGVKRGCG